MKQLDDCVTRKRKMQLPEETRNLQRGQYNEKVFEFTSFGSFCKQTKQSKRTVEYLIVKKESLANLFSSSLLLAANDQSLRSFTTWRVCKRNFLSHNDVQYQ